MRTRTVLLRHGPGTGQPGDRCAIQEHRARLGLDPKSDAVPKTDCWVLVRAVTVFNDLFPPTVKGAKVRTTTLLPYLDLLTGTRAAEETEWKRAWAAVDVVARVIAADELARADFGDLAVALRELAPLVGSATGKQALAVLEEAYCSGRGCSYASSAANVIHVAIANDDLVGTVVVAARAAAGVDGFATNVKRILDAMFRSTEADE